MCQETGPLRVHAIVSIALSAFMLGQLTARSMAAQIRAESLDGSKIGVIAISGKIEYGDDRRFLDLALARHSAIVVLSSPGGSLDAGLLVARVIRRLNFTTVVLPNAICASACAIAWIGGSQRFLSDDGRVGFHAAYTERDGKTSESGVANALVGAFYNEIGLPSRAITYLTQAPPDGIQWLSLNDARDLGIEAERFESLREPKKETGEPPAQRAVHWRVRSNVSQGIQNVRAGPGTTTQFKFSIPAGTGGIKISECRTPIAGGGKFDWCYVTWQGQSGWSSSNGYEVDLASP